MRSDREHPNHEGDDIGTLVRLAGKRHAVPRERMERVRRAARAEWEHEARRRTRRRNIWFAAGLATAASLTSLLVFRVLPTASRPVAAPLRVEAISGAAWRASDEAPGRKTIELGDEIESASELTTSEEGRLALRMASGHSLRLDRSTGVRLLEDGSLALDRGAVYVDSASEATAADALRVRTALGVVHEIGTQFEVRLDDDAVLVRLREGAVIVRRDNRDHEVQVGTELALSPDGSLTRREFPAHGPQWDWLVDVTPMLDLEGRSARTFLEWVARERGWRLVFADEQVARSAEEIELGGTVQQLTLDEALEAVLPTCGLSFRIDRDLLVIGDAETLRPL